jgi:hypothetical protein
MAVTVRTRPVFEASAPRPLFKTTLPTALNPYRMDYSPAPDGQRFLMNTPSEGAVPPSLTVVLNWPSLMRK